jgi:hypothetical protein
MLNSRLVVVVQARVKGVLSPRTAFSETEVVENIHKIRIVDLEGSF